MAAAWNLIFEVPDRGASARPEVGWTTVDDDDLLPVPATEPAGWAGTAGPSIAWENWPRSSTTGLPMTHAFTLTLPEDFRRQGADRPAIAFFAGEGQFAENQPATVPDAASSDAFLRDLAAATDHPGLRRRRDIIGGEFALMWLTEAEARPSDLPVPDLRQDGLPADWSEGTVAWNETMPTLKVWLVPREDPNAGLAPIGLWDTDADHTSVFGDDNELTAWASTAYDYAHLGGTAFPIQALPDGLTPWYLEIDEFGPLNFGGGSAQIDLESDTFDWAC